MSDYQIKAILWLLLLTCQPLSTFNRETLGELYKPLQDSLVTRCVEIMDLDKTKTTQSSAASILKSIWSKVYPKPRRCWLPTGCLVRVSWIIHKPDKQIDFYMRCWLPTVCSFFLQKLLDVLHEVLPKMSLIASDFSYLPDVKIPGERAPLVSTKVYSSYIFPK